MKDLSHTDDSSTKTVAELVELLSNGNVQAEPDYVTGEGVIRCKICRASVRVWTEESAKAAIEFSKEHTH